MVEFSEYQQYTFEGVLCLLISVIAYKIYKMKCTSRGNWISSNSGGSSRSLELPPVPTRRSTHPTDECSKNNVAII
jgi:hypothetical protein